MHILAIISPIIIYAKIRSWTDSSTYEHLICILFMRKQQLQSQHIGEHIRKKNMFACICDSTFIQVVFSCIYTYTHHNKLHILYLMDIAVYAQTS